MSKAAGGAGAGGAGAGASESHSLSDIFKEAVEMITANGSSHSLGEPVLEEVQMRYPFLLPTVGERVKKEGHPPCKETNIGKYKTPVFIGVSCFARVVRSDSKPKNSVWVEIPPDAGERCCLVDSKDKALRYGRNGYVCFLKDTRLVFMNDCTHECKKADGYMWQYGYVPAENGGTVYLEIENKHLYIDKELSNEAFVTSDNEAGAGAGAAAGAGKATKQKTPRGGGAGAGPTLPRKRTRRRRQTHRKHTTRRRRARI